MLFTRYVKSIFFVISHCIGTISLIPRYLKKKRLLKNCLFPFHRKEVISALWTFCKKKWFSNVANEGYSCFSYVHVFHILSKKNISKKNIIVFNLSKFPEILPFNASIIKSGAHSLVIKLEKVNFPFFTQMTIVHF